MKKITLCLLFVLLSTFSKAQNLSYGALIEGNFYQSNNNSSENQFISDGNPFTVNIGGYLDYNFNSNIGIKTDLTIGKKELKYNDIADYKLIFIDISPSLKYDFGKEYRKGFYMLIGTRVSFLSSAKVEGQKANDMFENTNLGLQLGFGQRIFDYVDLQAKFDYGITPFYKNDIGQESKFFGIYFSAHVDLEKILNKNK